MRPLLRLLGFASQGATGEENGRIGQRLAETTWSGRTRVDPRKLMKDPDVRSLVARMAENRPASGLKLTPPL